MPRHLLALVTMLSFTAPAPAHDAGAHMEEAARHWLASLSPELRARAAFAFEDAERLDWHFVPRVRRGVSFKQMTQQQRWFAHRLLVTALSPEGYDKALGILALETVLAELEGRPEYRDTEQYFFTVFGEPGREPWGWRFEGHHIAVNITRAAGRQTVTTPHFLGANPATVPSGPLTGMRVLAAAEDLGRDLARSLRPEQLKEAAILDAVPRDIFNIPGRNATKPEGVPWARLDAAQREALLALVREYTGRFHGAQSDAALRRLEIAGLDTLHFAWVGSLEAGRPHYYRVQAGSFVLEYDNIQNNANHVHSIWRDFDGEFGADLLGEHVKSAH